MQCAVHFNNVRTKNSWFYVACGQWKCKKAIRKVGPSFWCDACNIACEFPRTSYRIQINVADTTCALVVSLFVELAEKLLNKKAATLLSEVEDSSDGRVLPKEIEASNEQEPHLRAPNTFILQQWGILKLHCNQNY